MSKFTNADSTKRMLRAMVARKRFFSNPRRVWKPELKLSTPKAPPKDAPVRCSKIAPINRTASPICTKGNTPWRRTIGCHAITGCLPKSNRRSLGMCSPPSLSGAAPSACWPQHFLIQCSVAAPALPLGPACETRRRAHAHARLTLSKKRGG